MNVCAPNLGWPSYYAEGFTVITTDLLAGWLLPSATWRSETSGLDSGKYVAAQPRGMSYFTTLNRRTVRCSPS